MKAEGGKEEGRGGGGGEEKFFPGQEAKRQETEHLDMLMENMKDRGGAWFQMMAGSVYARKACTSTGTLHRECLSTYVETPLTRKGK